MNHLPIACSDSDWTRFASIIAGRRSYKQPFAPDPIPRELIDRCIDLARWAPSAHNAQPWRFLVFYRQDNAHQALRERLVSAMGEKFAADLARSGTLAPERVSTATRARNQRFLDAPVLVLALVDTSVLDAYDDRERMAAEMTMGVQSVAAALQTMLLALHVTGLAACWYCAPLFADRIVHDVLGVPQAWHAQAFIATGLPAGNTAIDRRLDGRMGGTERRALEEIAFDPWYFQAGGRGEGGGERP